MKAGQVFHRVRGAQFSSPGVKNASGQGPSREAGERPFGLRMRLKGLILKAELVAGEIDPPETPEVARILLYRRGAE